MTAADLDADVRRDLRSLSPDRAEQVAGHLVAAGVLIDEDAARALEHARTARALGARLAVVREAVGLTAYAAGEYREAAAELRAYRRMSGSPEHLAVLADCERALGRPERALAMLEDPDVPSLASDATMELLIVASGARRDLGDADAAVAVLEIAELDSPTVRPWTARLWYAYADALLHAGRQQEAVRWFTAVAAIDDDETDADERLAALEPNESARADVHVQIESAVEPDTAVQFGGLSESHVVAFPEAPEHSAPVDQSELPDHFDSEEATGEDSGIADESEVLSDAADPGGSEDDAPASDDVRPSNAPVSEGSVEHDDS